MFTILLRLSTQDQMRELHKQGSEKLNTEGNNICRAILVFSRDDFELYVEGNMKNTRTFCLEIIFYCKCHFMNIRIVCLKIISTSSKVRKFQKTHLLKHKEWMVARSHQF